MHNGEWHTGSGCALLGAHVGIMGIAKPPYAQCKGNRRCVPPQTKRSRSANNNNNNNNKIKQPPLHTKKSHPKRCIFPLQLTVLWDPCPAGAKSSKLSTCLHGRNARPADSIPKPPFFLIFSPYLGFFSPSSPKHIAVAHRPRGLGGGDPLFGVQGWGTVSCPFVPHFEGSRVRAMPNSTLNAGQGCPQWAWGGGVHAAFKWGSFIGVLSPHRGQHLGGVQEGNAQRREGSSSPIRQHRGMRFCTTGVLEGTAL